jgi:hypothetical protein
MPVGLQSALLRTPPASLGSHGGGPGDPRDPTKGATAVSGPPGCTQSGVAFKVLATHVGPLRGAGPPPQNIYNYNSMPLIRTLPPILSLHRSRRTEKYILLHLKCGPTETAPVRGVHANPTLPATPVAGTYVPVAALQPFTNKIWRGKRRKGKW